MSSKAGSGAAGKLMKLYMWPRCPYCQKAEITAKERGIVYERVELPAEMPEWYKKINPNETVPTLELEDGKHVFESNLIAQFFDNSASPACTLMGNTPYERHRVEFFMSQVGAMVTPCYGVLRCSPNSEEYAQRRKELDDAVAYLDGILAENQKTGGPYFFDERFTMADIAVLPFLIRFSAVLSYFCSYDLFAKGPHLKRLCAAGRQRPSVSQTTFSAHSYIEFYERNLPKDAFIRAAQCGPVLYGNSFCPFVDRARLACAVKGFKPHYIEINLPDQPAWYKYVNCRETVPTLVTEHGEHVHESQLIAQYVDSAVKDGPALVPRDDPRKTYAAQYFVTMADYFVGAYYGLLRNPKSTEAKEELVWVIGEVGRLMAGRPFGEGPYCGGASWNAGDVALAPFVMRLKATTPELTGGYDAFAEFPFLDDYLDACIKSGIPNGIFKTPAEYLQRSREHFAKSS